MPPTQESLKQFKVQRRVLTESRTQEISKINQGGCFQPSQAFSLKPKPIKDIQTRSFTTSKSAIKNQDMVASKLQKTEDSLVAPRNKSFKITKKSQQMNREHFKTQLPEMRKIDDLSLNVKSFTRTPSPIKKQKLGVSKAFDSFTYQGTREYNEDRILIKENIKIKNQDFQLFAVFDGHGGSSASEYLKMYFAQTLEKCASKFQASSSNAHIPNILRESILEIEKKIVHNGTKIISGSCGTFMLICEETRTYYAANVGDSRILFVDEKGNVTQITEDHKPEQTKEKERILKQGGEIYRSTFTHPETKQKIEGPWRTLPGKLSVSRTFGDTLIKKAKKGVIVADPDLFTGKIPENTTILLMSDGAYEKVENFQFSYFFSNQNSLAKQFIEFNQMIKKRNTNDNVSVIGIKTNLLSCMKDQEDLIDSEKVSLINTAYSSTKSNLMSLEPIAVECN